ncbi:MAG TPA: transcription termination/antitermination NusG family protein [Candidatus Aminicenantes bacterium]|nr:transcription termination/antitermination NusG family protein [Acidobacteriota bacterium]HOI44117.1 transcription termination/antitermination NusG family protein [Candidatus Aminicenantes bacterium]
MENWFVINTKPKKESQVEKLFIEGGFKIYNPKYRDEKTVKPFFPGYAFLRFDHPCQYQTVKYTRGLKRVVGNREGPIPIPEEVIQGLQARERDGFIEFPKYGEAPGVGDEIEVAEGPLKGLKGIFKKEIGDKERVMILLNYVSYQGVMLIEKKKLKKIAR